MRPKLPRQPALLIIPVTVILIGGAVGGYLATRSPAAAPAGSRAAAASESAKPLIPASPRKCTPNAMLVNPCRPWVGAAVNRLPGAPANKVIQFDYAEHLIGRPLDIFRDYHRPPRHGQLSALPLNRSEITIAKRPDSYVDVNWRPVTHWAQADGGDSAVNSLIARVAASIKSIAPREVFLTIVHEPQASVTSDPGGPHCGVSPKANGGTPAQYIAMWRNVESIFRAHGTRNVIWTMDYLSYKKFNCMVPLLWPGNSMVDWVLYDAYSRNAQDTWNRTIGPFYQLLLHDSSSHVNFDSKPWGLGEFGTCSNPDATAAQDFYLQAKAAFEANEYPRLKMYLPYEDAAGPKAGRGCLSNYTAQGRLDPTKQSDFNQFIDALLAGYK